jgi:hypothetical protein
MGIILCKMRIILFKMGIILCKIEIILFKMGIILCKMENHLRRHALCAVKRFVLKVRLL